MEGVSTGKGQTINLVSSPNHLAAPKAKVDTRGKFITTHPAEKPGSTWRNQTGDGATNHITYGKNGEVITTTQARGDSRGKTSFLSAEPYTPLKKMADDLSSGKVS
jgi:hypothetical protein